MDSSTLPIRVPPAVLMDRCRALDVHLWVADGLLRFDAPRGALDDELRAALVVHKAALVALLTEESDRTSPGEPAGTDVGAEREEWERFGRDVRRLQSAGREMAAAVRAAYQAWFGVDLGLLDPAPLACLVERVP